MSTVERLVRICVEDSVLCDGWPRTRQRWHRTRSGGRHRSRHSMRDHGMLQRTQTCQHRNTFTRSWRTCHGQPMRWNGPSHCCKAVVSTRRSGWKRHHWLVGVFTCCVQYFSCRALQLGGEHANRMCFIR